LFPREDTHFQDSWKVNSLAIDFREGRIIDVSIQDEMKRSYIDYAMSTIVARALPDVRDGLKPVQRRILYSMGELGIWSNRQHKKSARIVGEVMGKYHPHGDMSIYDAMVRMAQDFSYRYMLVDGHGNFGSVDGDPPAAMRYTEARLAKLAEYMLTDIGKDTVDFGPNFDETMQQPLVLPAAFPNLLVNGTAGIAVGMATNIPPHNLGEVVDGLVMLIDSPDATIDELMKAVKGPDFPTAGIILGVDDIKQAYKTGRGRITIRARTQLEEMRGGRVRIVITELPYQVNKANLIEKIAALHRDKKVEGISSLRDESDRHGLRIVMELKRDVSPHVVLNQLYKHTQLQDTFGAILLALDNGKPRVMNLKQLMVAYLDHRKVVVTRRTRFDLNKAEEHAHILEGLRIALDNIDEIINLIRAADSDDAAKSQLMERFDLTERQAVAILDMRLRRLTGLERDKIEEEYKELLKTIDELRGILADERKIMGIIREELLEVKDKFADERRTEISAEEDKLDVEDLIAREDIVITLTHQGYIKRLPVTSYRSQRRGGRGTMALSTRQEDFVKHLFITSTHSYVLFFTNKGKVYRLKGHQIPEASRQAKGTAIVNLIQIDPGERIHAAIAISRYDDEHYLVMITKKGIVKKTALGEFDSPHNGLIGINLDEDDELIEVRLTRGNTELLLVTAEGQSIRFHESDVRSTGRATRGVKGIDLVEGDYVVGMDIASEDAELLVVTENGYGKRTPIAEYRTQSRGGKGIKTFNHTEKNGRIAGIKVVRPENEVMFITSKGVMIRLECEGISVQGRYTQGVKLMRLDDDDSIVAMAVLPLKDNGDDGDDNDDDSEVEN